MNLLGRQLLELPELQRAQVVKVHPSIGASALRSALVMAKKTVPEGEGERVGRGGKGCKER